MDKNFLKDLIWIRRGSQRRAIIQVMSKPMFPSEIQKKVKEINQKISLNNCSDVLRSFVKVKIAECVNPHEKVGRLYKLTKKGERIRKEIM